MVNQNDNSIEWSYFWNFFISSSCDNEMRKKPLNELRLLKLLFTLTTKEQVKVLKDAPNVIKEHELIFFELPLEAIDELGIKKRNDREANHLRSLILDDLRKKYKIKQ